MTATSFGQLILFSIHFLRSFLHFLLSFRFIGEDAPITQDSILPLFQTCQLTFVKTSPLHVVISTLFSVIGHVIKDGVSCLTYYEKREIQ